MIQFFISETRTVTEPFPGAYCTSKNFESKENANQFLAKKREECKKMIESYLTCYPFLKSHAILQENENGFSCKIGGRTYRYSMHIREICGD